jgi:hypothetical protein
MDDDEAAELPDPAERLEELLTRYDLFGVSNKSVVCKCHYWVEKFALCY